MDGTNISNASSNNASSNNDTTDTTKAAQRHAAEMVIAATAGRDTWQTWAGRNQGTENFEYLDVFRGIKRSIHHNLQSNVPKPGTPCPICFCEPETDEELSSSSSSFWHITWCGHAVCKDCLGQYANNQVGDREQSGPLKCPVCLKTLRKKDAIVAMMAGKHKTNNEDLIQQWDVKMRNQFLRAIPFFRSCPKCGSGSSSGSSGGSSSGGTTNGEGNGNIGGGFVTPECLGSQHQERREAATKIMLQRNYAYIAIAFVYLVLVATIALTESQSPQADLWSMLLPIYAFVKTGMAVNYLLARKAREALFRSISVECPCCDEVFVLPAESTLIEDEETSRWVNANTRPCPNCSVPIVKNGGCNHIKCSHCQITFCWACMKLQRACRAYKCQNGAPYRNASFLEDGEENRERRQALQSDGSILTYIDFVLNHRVCPELQYRDGLLVLACLVARHFRWVQFLESEIVSPFIVYLFEKTDSFVSPFLLIVLVFLATPSGWLVPLGQLLPQGHYNAFLILIISFCSLPIGLCMSLGYFVNQILPIIQQRRQLLERERGRPMPENPQIEEFNQTILNQVLRRSIEDT